MDWTGGITFLPESLEVKCVLSSDIFPISTQRAFETPNSSRSEALRRNMLLLHLLPFSLNNDLENLCYFEEPKVNFEWLLIDVVAVVMTTNEILDFYPRNLAY